MNTRSKTYYNTFLTNTKGNTTGLNVQGEPEYFHIPGLDGHLVAFNVDGDSMAPTIRSGDTVICTALECFGDLVDNKIYAIVTTKAIWVKRVRKFLDNQKNWTHLQLFPENTLEHDAFTIPIQEVVKIMKVTKRVTGLA